MFTRLSDLFGNKINGRGLFIYADAEKGIFSEAFKLWCRKLADLNESDFVIGMAGVEKKAEAMFRDGEEMWPPSYAEFRAMCFPKATRDTLAHKYFEPLIGIEDQTARAARYELGRQESAKLLGMLGSRPQDYQGSTQEAARASLDRAKQLLEASRV